MKAVTWHGGRDVRVEETTDAILAMTSAYDMSQKKSDGTIKVVLDPAA